MYRLEASQADRIRFDQMVSNFAYWSLRETEHADSSDGELVEWLIEAFDVDSLDCDDREEASARARDVFKREVKSWRF